jgi:hypothetical protein
VNGLVNAYRCPPYGRVEPQHHRTRILDRESLDSSPEDVEGFVLPQEHQWPESHADQTDVLPAASDSNDGPTDRYPNPRQPAETDDESAEAGHRWRKPAFIAGAVFGVLALLYGVDLLISQGSVPRGVTVAGVEVGGMSQSDAEQELREQIEPRLAQPVQIAAGRTTP